MWFYLGSKPLGIFGKFPTIKFWIDLKLILGISRGPWTSLRFALSPYKRRAVTLLRLTGNANGKHCGVAISLPGLLLQRRVIKATWLLPPWAGDRYLRLLTPFPSLQCGFCLPSLSPRTQPWDRDVVLRLPGWHMWLNPVKTSVKPSKISWVGTEISSCSHPRPASHVRSLAY